MVDREKVIAGLECHRVFNCEIDAYTKTMCPYWDHEECSQTLMADALELLKEQEPVKPKKWVPKGQAMARVRGYYCPVCDTSVVRGDRFCHWCGRELTWDE